MGAWVCRQRAGGIQRAAWPAVGVFGPGAACACGEPEACAAPLHPQVWASGIMLFVMLFGCFPFEHDKHKDPNSEEAHLEVRRGGPPAGEVPRVCSEGAPLGCSGAQGGRGTRAPLLD
jgi:hypothetical protein